MRYLISATLILTAIIHLLPLPGVLGSERLAALYGLDVLEPNLAILMRHRAVLFGLLGVYLAIAAFRPAWQPAAFLAGLISVVTFLWLARSTGHYNAQIARVVAADVVALVALLIGAGAYIAMRRAALAN
jgi:hypothetical protein